MSDYRAYREALLRRALDLADETEMDSELLAPGYPDSATACDARYGYAQSVLEGRALDGDGDPDTACGRGPCALGYGHAGECRC